MPEPVELARDPAAVPDQGRLDRFVGDGDAERGVLPRERL
jgi:hypothetical protein